jgi:hypothetical protein
MDIAVHVFVGGMRNATMLREAPADAAVVLTFIGHEAAFFPHAAAGPIVLNEPLTPAFAVAVALVAAGLLLVNRPP